MPDVLWGWADASCVGECRGLDPGRTVHKRAAPDVAQMWCGLSVAGQVTLEAAFLPTLLRLRVN